jgi:hypothetical protein
VKRREQAPRNEYIFNLILAHPPDLLRGDACVALNQNNRSSDVSRSGTKIKAVVLFHNQWINFSAGGRLETS